MPINVNPLNENTLIIAPQWIGDAVMALSLVQALADAAPHAKRYVLATPWVADVFAHHPALCDTLIFPAKRGQLAWRERQRFAREHIAPLGCHTVYVLPNSWKSALIPWFAGIKKRVGYLGEARWGLLNHLRHLPPAQRSFHQSWRYRALLSPPSPSPFGLLSHGHTPKLHATWQLPPPLTQLHQNSRHGVALCIGAEYGPAKQWPSTHWQKLIIGLHQRGFGVMLLGTHKDKPMQINILQGLAETHLPAPLMPVLPLCGDTTLRDAVGLLADSAAVFSNDSGLMHVAAALSKPLVAFFGSSNEHATAPLAHPATPTTLLARTDLSCRPCLAKTCRFGHYDCLGGLTPDLALAAFDTMMAKSPKKTLRQTHRARRQKVMQQGAANINRALSQKLIAFFRAEARKPASLGCYAAIHDEPDLADFYIWAREQGWQLALPSIEERNTPSMAYRMWAAEVANTAQTQSALMSPNIILLPCVGFNGAGFRLGYGGGYFDRYLQKRMGAGKPSPLIVGIALDENQIDLPFAETHDMPMHYLITPHQQLRTLQPLPPSG